MKGSSRVIVAGAALETIAVLDQLQWQALHGAREPFSDITAAHAPIYAGAALGALGAGLALAERPSASAAKRVALVLLVVAAIVRAGAFAYDAGLHAAGADPTAAHDLYRAGAALAAIAIAALVVTRFTGARSRLRSRAAARRQPSGYEYPTRR